MNTIIQDKNIRFGKFIFKGTRIAIEDIVESLLSGLTIEEIKESYPSIKDSYLKEFIKFMRESFKKEINYLEKNLTSSKEIEKLYKYKGCFAFLKNLKPQHLQKKEFLKNPELLVCLKTFLSILKKYQSSKGKYEIFA